MRLVVLGFLMGLAASCSSGTRNLAADGVDSYDVAVARFRLANTISASCGKGKGSAVPGQFIVSDDYGTEAVQACGLIATTVEAPAFRAKFQSELCGKRTDCDAQFNEMFVARLIERYVLADWRAINLHCKAYPMECNSFSALEGWSRESHNKNVARIANQRSEEIARQREAAILDEERQQAASLVSAARAALATYLRMRYPAAVAPDVINR
ncbi:MAG TPA: hypothetical protein PLF40_02520 [Kofleriaceae bacterium]|jgi:hypothetical protein|nr:hypothetical protein [Kofleriaceae bacterium]